MTKFNFLKRLTYTIIILFGLTITFTGCEDDEVGSNDTFNCISGNCVADANGTYASLADCQSNCSNTGSGCNGQTTFTDPRDGQTYDIVEIGNQCWFAENLNYQTGNSWCYDNSSSNCNTYGRLYDWQTALTACPSGWHLPSDAEWTILTDYLGGESVAGGKMKSTTGWNSPNTGATNSSGFSGLPGGARDGSGDFGVVGYSGSWWSSTEGSTADAWSPSLYYSNGVVSRYYYSKTFGLSCRCLRD